MIRAIIDKIIIRSMNTGDLDQVVAIELDSFSSSWTRAHFQSELDSTASFPLVAVCPDGSIAGYICPTLVLDEGEILDLAVKMEFRGGGVGRSLVNAALGSFKSRGALRLFLEVRVTNNDAIYLYRSAGFNTCGRRKNYYEDGEDALLMDYTINGAEYYAV